MKDLKIVNGVLVERLNKKLTDITIPDGVTKIGCSAFQNCTELTSITIPNSVTSIGSSAFYNCYKLIEVVNYSFLDIAAGECYNNGYIGYYAKHIITDEKDSYLTTDENGYIFYDDGSNVYLLGYAGTDTELVLPKASPNGKAYGIYPYAFYKRCELANITIPGSVQSIGEYAFYECTNLKTVTFAGNSQCSSIGEYAFYGCTGLTSIIIPNSVTSIGKYAFSGCTGLTSVTLPDSVTSIGAYAFDGCTGLTSVTIPNSMTYIGEYAFDGCCGLISQIKNYKAFDIRDGHLSCRCVPFTPTEWSDQIDNIEICQRGYHYCTNLFDIFNYYFGKIDEDIAIYECEVGDETYLKEDDDSKCVTNKIKPVKRLYREDIIRILNGQD